MENKVNKLPLMELFNTLQGEGFHTGKPATFIRLAGCDVGCFWCDVKESWDSDLHPSISEESIVRQALNWHYKPFQIPNKILNEWRKIGKRGQLLENKWNKIYKKRKSSIELATFSS